MKVFIDFDENELSCITALKARKLLEKNGIEVNRDCDVIIFIRSRFGKRKFRIYVQDKFSELAHLIERRLTYREEKRGILDYDGAEAVLLDISYEYGGNISEKAKLTGICCADAVIEYFGGSFAFDAENMDCSDAVYTLYTKGIINVPDYWIDACEEVFGIEKIIKQTAKKEIKKDRQV